MIGRVLLILICAGALMAQLPPAQAPPPRDPKASDEPAARVDAVVVDAVGRPVTGLTAADFTLEAGGKPQKVAGCEYRQEPQRLAIIIDDLSLPPDRLNEARRALRDAVSKFPPGDEAAILRASAGEGALDRFTADARELNRAIDRAAYNPIAEAPPSDAFATGALGTLRAALEGMREVEGRKAVLLISERLRDPERVAVAWTSNLVMLAGAAGARIYAVDMANEPAQQPVLDQGLAIDTRRTGGLFVEGGDVAKAFARIEQDRGYYRLEFHPDVPERDVVVKTARENTFVRAPGRAAVENEPAPQHEPDADFLRAPREEFCCGDVRLHVSPVLSQSGAWEAHTMLHVDARDLTHVQRADGSYHVSLDVAVALYDARGTEAARVARAIQFKVPAAEFGAYREGGQEFTIPVPLRAPGSYEVRVTARDGVTGKLGSARQFVRADWGPAKLSVSSIVLGAAGDNGRLARAAAVRRFQPGEKIAYEYDLYNLKTDAQKRADIESRVRIWREGVIVRDVPPASIAFPASDNPGARNITGTISLSDKAAPGKYVFGITITDKLANRSATQYTDFEVRP